MCPVYFVTCSPTHLLTYDTKVRSVEACALPPRRQDAKGRGLTFFVFRLSSFGITWSPGHLVTWSPGHPPRRWHAPHRPKHPRRAYGRSGRLLGDASALSSCLMSRVSLLPTLLLAHAPVIYEARTIRYTASTLSVTAGQENWAAQLGARLAMARSRFGSASRLCTAPASA